MNADWAGISYTFGNSISDGKIYQFAGWIKILNYEPHKYHKVELIAKVTERGISKYIPQMSMTIVGNKWTKLKSAVSITSPSVESDVTLYIKVADRQNYLVDDLCLVLPETTEETGTG